MQERRKMQVQEPIEPKASVADRVLPKERRRMGVNHIIEPKESALRRAREVLKTQRQKLRVEHTITPHDSAVKRARQSVKQGSKSAMFNLLNPGGVQNIIEKKPPRISKETKDALKERSKEAAKTGGRLAVRGAAAAGRAARPHVERAGRGVWNYLKRKFIKEVAPEAAPIIQLLNPPQRMTQIPAQSGASSDKNGRIEPRAEDIEGEFIVTSKGKK